jgi:hypothetical protein
MHVRRLERADGRTRSAPLVGAAASVRRFVGPPSGVSLRSVTEAHDTLIVNPRIELIGEDEISATARVEAGAAPAAGEKRKQVVSFFLATTSSTRRRICYGGGLRRNSRGPGAARSAPRPKASWPKAP